MLGTSPQVDYWILLEYSPRWSSHAIEDNSFPDAIQNWLNAAVLTLESKGFRPRVQFIRQTLGVNQDYHAFFSAKGNLIEFTFRTYNALLDLNPPEFDMSHPQLNRIEGVRYFVCTNGTRDLCCAKFGILTWKALNQISDGRAWQCSHLGGHRFAPNVLVLPNARMYGRVHTEDVESFFESVEQGKIALNHLRGRTAFTPAGQACEALVQSVVEEELQVSFNTVRFQTNKGIEIVDIPPRGAEIQVRSSCSQDKLTGVRPFRIFRSTLF